MTDLFQNASDDQLAMMGCAAALIFSTAVMYFSFYLGRSTRDAQAKSQPLTLGQAPQKRNEKQVDRAA